MVMTEYKNKVGVMNTARWREFKQNYPQLSDQLITTGSELYEMGAEKAKTAPQLDKLVEFLSAAPVEVREELGFSSTVDRVTVLARVFESGSALLLNYLHNGC
jgi:hypothetical protein